MARDRRSKDLEDLRGENRQLQKLVKELKKQVARKQKNLKKYEDIEATTEVEETAPVSQKDPIKCDKCGANTTDITLGKMGTVRVCSKDNTHRKRIK